MPDSNGAISSVASEASGTDDSATRKFLTSDRQITPSRKLPCLAALGLVWKLADWGGRIGFAVDIAHYARDAFATVVAVVLLPQFGVALACLGFVLPDIVEKAIALIEALEPSVRTGRAAAPGPMWKSVWRSQ